MGRWDWIGLAAAAGVLGLMLLFRDVYVEPREWGSLCLGAAPPLACRPRAALLWLQHWQLWGGGAALLGLWAWIGAAGGRTPRTVAVSGTTQDKGNARDA
jgi:hypothetical protein